MITYGSNLMTKADADAFVLANPTESDQITLKEISSDYDLYEVQVIDVQGLGSTAYASLLVYEGPLPELVLPETTTDEDI